MANQITILLCNLLYKELIKFLNVFITLLILNNIFYINTYPFINLFEHFIRN